MKNRSCTRKKMYINSSISYILPELCVKQGFCAETAPKASLLVQNFSDLDKNSRKKRPKFEASSAVEQWMTAGSNSVSPVAKLE